MQLFHSQILDMLEYAAIYVTTNNIKRQIIYFRVRPELIFQNSHSPYEVRS